MPIEAPALNPTGGVTVKKPVVLDYNKDPTHPGAGIFIIHGKKGQFKDLPEGTIISTSEEENNSEGEVTLPANAVTLSILIHTMNHNDRDSTHYLPFTFLFHLFLSSGTTYEFQYLADHELCWRWGCDASFSGHVSCRK